mgnify:CR=1 FL=1
MDKYSKRTRAVHGGIRRSQYGELSEAMFMTQAFSYPSAEAAEARFVEAGDDEFIYARYGNPTNRMFEDRLAQMEGTEDAFACTSGMAAVNGALMALTKAGDHVVSSRALFGSCLYIIAEQLPKFGIETVLVDGTNLDEWKQALSGKTRCVFLETPSNPCLEIIDIRAVSDLAHEAGASLIVDNVFATPIYQHPLQLGADIVMYSTTKHIDGQGRCLGGVVLASEEWIDENLHDYYRHTGPAMSPFNAWVLLKGLETLDLRAHRQSENAVALGQMMEPRVPRILHPGLPSHPRHALALKQMRATGPIFAFDLGSRAKAHALLDALELIDLSNNIGDSRSLACHPASTTHAGLSEEVRAEMGVTEGLVRINVGLEDIEDIKEDMDRALSAAGF